jgi:hypothetical protein
MCLTAAADFSTGSCIRIRVETLDHFLRRYGEEIIKKRKATQEIESQLAALEQELRGQFTQAAPTMAAD